MIRSIAFTLAAIILFLLNQTAMAQTPEVRVEFKDEPVTVGQEFVLRITVLVPTFMPKPPIFPTFEATNIIVRLPEKSSTPTSATINGETWSGITRAYRLYPMEAGTTVIPPQDVTLFYAKDGDATDIETYTEQSPELKIVATLPDRARDLDPPLLATGLTISQTLIPREGPISIGGSIERNLSIKIDGTSPLFIPPLISMEPVAKLASYPRDPRVSETSSRGMMSGMREESVVYVAQESGPVTLPDISISWYNIESGDVETVELPGLTTEIKQPSVVVETVKNNLIGTLLSLALAIVLCWLIWVRFLRNHFLNLIRQISDNYSKSNHAAYNRASKAAESQDLRNLYRELETNPSLFEYIERDLLSLTQNKYGPTEVENAAPKAAWVAISQTIKRQRPRLTVAEILGLQSKKQFEVGRGFKNQAP